MAKRKPTKEEARRRIRELPDVPIPIRRLGPKGRALAIIGTGAKGLAELLVNVDPLNRTAPLPAQPLKTTRRTPESYARRAAIVEGVRDVGRAIGDFRLPEIRNPFRRDDRMNREDAIRRVVNDRTIKLTPEMMEVINNDDLLITEDGELVQSMDRDRQFERQNLLPRAKPKRKVSPYQKELGRQLKMLKKKHPRTPVIRLMKRAHRLTKKAMK